MKNDNKRCLSPFHTEKLIFNFLDVSLGSVKNQFKRICLRKSTFLSLLYLFVSKSGNLKVGL
jgi:hypothetical protein